MVIASNIKPPKGLNTVKKKNANTQDIIREILDANSERLELQVLEFSKQFSPTYEGLSQLWHWVKENIYYKEDPDGVQWIREPARLYNDDEGDCKSFTIFITSVLKNLNLNYTIRFVTYDSRSRQVTHVYPIAYLNNGQAVIMDAVWTRFDSQKEPFYLKKDYNFMEISRLSGIGASSTEQNLLNAARHMTNIVKNEPTYEVDLTNLSEMQAIRYLTGGNVAGVGVIGDAFALPVITVSGVGAGKGKRILQAISKVGKKAIEAIKKASKALINNIFQKILPKISPFFLFCFVKNSKGKVASAQKKQMGLINWIAKTCGTSPAVVLAGITKGINDKYKMSPTSVINSFVQGKMPQVKGIGIATEVIEMVFALIKKIVAFFKKKDAPALSTSDGSDLNVLKEQIENESDEGETEEVVEEEEDSVGKPKKVVKKRVVKKKVSKKVQTIPTNVVIEQNTKENIEKQREDPANEAGVNTPLTNDGIVTLANPSEKPAGELPTPQGEPKTKDLKVPALEKDDNMMMILGGVALLFVVANR